MKELVNFSSKPIKRNIFLLQRKKKRRRWGEKGHRHKIQINY